MVERSGRWLIAGSLLWIVVAIFGSGPAPDRDTWLGTSGVDTIFQVALVTFGLVGVATMVIAGRPEEGEWTPPPPQRRYRAFVLLVVLWVIAWRTDLIEEVIDRIRSQLDGTAAGRSATRERPEPTSAEPAEAPPATLAEVRDLLALVAVFVVAIAAVWWWRRRQPRQEPSGPPPTPQELTRDALHAAVQAAAGQLRTGAHDPRTRVLLAYRELEHALSERGLARGHSETTAEHVRRSIDRLGVDDGPLRLLNSLYERARFSDTPITDADVARAIDHLERAILTIEAST